MERTSPPGPRRYEVKWGMGGRGGSQIEEITPWGEFVYEIWTHPDPGRSWWKRWKMWWKDEEGWHTLMGFWIKKTDGKIAKVTEVWEVVPFAALVQQSAM